MKTKMETAIQMYDALVTLSQTEAPFRVNHWIMINIGQLQPHFDSFSKERDSIYKECLYEGADGLFVHKNKQGDFEFNIIGNKKAVWQKRFALLNNYDVNFSPIYLDMDLLMSENPCWNFKASLLLTLQPLINKKPVKKKSPGRRNNGTNHQTSKG